ncbi:MAG: cell division protein FtsL [Desulfobacterota bacterium]|nr:cell division protein FtsL [Thermodesulfobacteriota bacterium]
MKEAKVRRSARTEGGMLWTEGKGKPKGQGLPLRKFLLFGSLLCLLVGASLFYVWTRIRVIQLGYDISNALQENRALLEANKRMRLEVATLKSLERIERIAVEELRMVKPKPDQVIVIR